MLESQQFGESEGGGAADLDEFPAGVTPAGGMQLEAAVDDHLGCDQLSEVFWIELPELWPLGEVQHHLRAEQRLFDTGHLGKALAGWQSSLRVIDCLLYTSDAADE